MNSGLAVVLGALIALAGSSLIPWLRESLAARRMRDEDRRQRRDDALVELLAKNAKFAIAWNNKDASQQATAMEERARASMRLLLAIDDVSTRAKFSRLMNLSLPAASGRSAEAGTAIGTKMNALQDVLVRWSAGEIKSEDVLSEFERRVQSRTKATVAGDESDNGQDKVPLEQGHQKIQRPRSAAHLPRGPGAFLPARNASI